MFFNHGGFVDDDAFKASSGDLLCKCTCNCSNNAWKRFKDDLFKLVLILHKDLELTLVELFDLLDIKAEKGCTVLILFKWLSFDKMLVFFLFDINYCR